MTVVYDSNGRNQGTAFAQFPKPEHAAEAVAKMNGVKIDGKTLRMELMVDAKNIAPTVPKKSLADRMT